MNTAKKIILPALYTALLIGAQLVLSAIAGVELVTVLFLAFCYRYGIKQGALVATAFSLLRCILFGFFPSVVVLYLIYYNLFAVVVGALGNAFNHEYSLRKHAVIIITAVLLTVSFTLLDNLITPIMYSYTLKQAQAYFVASIPTMIPQIICTTVTASFIFPPLLKVLK